jgi:ribosomal protein S27E
MGFQPLFFMSDSKYLKGSCQHCNNHIEFPAEASGSVVSCPHCGSQVTLIADTSTAPQKSSQPTALFAIIGTVAIIALIGGGLFFWKQKRGSTPSRSSIPMAANINSNSADQSVTTTSNTNATSSAQTGTKKPKSPSDLTVGDIQLQQTKGSSLVYANGTLKNDSDYQRFGIRLELDLFDAKGQKLSTKAQDYINVIEPHHDWQFHALVVDSKAKSAKVGSIKEED